MKPSINFGHPQDLENPQLALNYYEGKKSCITLDGWNPISNGINHLSTGINWYRISQPSTVVFTFKGRHHLPRGARHLPQRLLVPFRQLFQGLAQQRGGIQGSTPARGNSRRFHAKGQPWWHLDSHGEHTSNNSQFFV